MPSLPELCERARRGDHLWPRHWARLGRGDDEAVIDAILDAIERLPLGLVAPEPALEALQAIAGRALGAARLGTPERAERLCRAMVTAFDTASSFSVASRWPQFRALFERLGEPLCPSLRAILEGPPRRVFAEWDRGHYRFGGARLLAARVVAQHPEADDAARLERLAQAGDPMPTPLVARLLAAVLRSAEAGREALRWICFGNLAEPSSYLWAGQAPESRTRCCFDLAGPAIVPLAVACLEGDDWELRLRLVELLPAFGPPARPYLTALAVRTSDWRVKEACRRIDTAIVLAAHRPRQSTDRSLSRAPRAAVDERSLSPAEDADG